MVEFSQPPPPPAAWRVAWRDYKGHRLGRAPPHPHQQDFDCRADARAELGRLRAMPGAEIAGCIAPVLPKLAVEQTDFGFPLNARRRMTP